MLVQKPAQINNRLKCDHFGRLKIIIVQVTNVAKESLPHKRGFLLTYI